MPSNKYTAARFGYQQGPLNAAVAYGVTKTATTDDFKTTNAVVSYDFGPATAMLMANVSNYGAKKLTILELGVIAPVAQVGQFRYQRANASGGGTDANDAHQFAVGYIRNLSKRTAIYGTYSTISNDSGAAFVIGTPPVAVAGKSSKGYEVGIKHSF